MNYKDYPSHFSLEDLFRMTDKNRGDKTKMVNMIDDEYLIELGLLNKNGEKDKCNGYVHKDCVNCGRHRVLNYESGIKVCEKCGTDQNTGEYVEDRYYNPY